MRMPCPGSAGLPAIKARQVSDNHRYCRDFSTARCRWLAPRLGRQPPGDEQVKDDVYADATIVKDEEAA